MEVRQEEKRLRALLAPLDRLETVKLRKRNPGHHSLIVAAVAASVLVVVGVGVAAGWGPLSGLTAADRPATPADAPGEALQSQLKTDQAPAGSAIDQVGARLADSARLVGTLPNEHKVYTLASTKGKLCIAVASLAESCGPPLSHASPITFTIVDPDGPGGVAPIAYGVALDGVTSVSFRVAGAPVTVPVHGNFFAYQASSADTGSDFSAPSVTFRDGSTQPVG
jgi:hypothetical protein